MTYKLIDPNGQEVQFESIYRFTLDNNIPNSGISSLLSDKHNLYHFRGYTRNLQDYKTYVKLECSVEDLPNEEWKSNDNYPGYRISNLGRVKSLPRRIECKTGRIMIKKGKVLKPCKDAVGYYHYRLPNKEGVIKVVKAHRIVAETFIPNPDSKRTVDHINFDKSDNRVCNLRWLSGADNVKSAASAGRLSNRKDRREYYNLCSPSGDLITVHRKGFTDFCIANDLTPGTMRQMFSDHGVKSHKGWTRAS